MLVIKKSNWTTFFTITLPKFVDNNHIKTFNEITDDSDDLQGEGIKINVPSNLIDNYTRLELLLALNMPVHTDTLTETGAIIDEFFQRT